MGPFPVVPWPPVPTPAPLTPGEKPFPPGTEPNPVPPGPYSFPFPSGKNPLKTVPPGLEPPITGIPSIQSLRYSSIKIIHEDRETLIYFSQRGGNIN